MKVSFDSRFTLVIVFWLSTSLTTPIIHGMGYALGIFTRALLTGIALIIYTIADAYPIPAASITFFLLGFTGLSAWLSPRFLAKLMLSVYYLTANSMLFWPAVVIAAATLSLLFILIKFKKPLIILFCAGLATFVPLWYLYVDSAYPAAVWYTVCWLVLLSYNNGSRLWGSQHNRTVEAVNELREGWLRYTSSLLLSVLFFTLLLPKGFGPIPWTSFQNWADAAFPFLSELRGVEAKNIRGSDEEFGLFSISFQETSRLGGPLWEDRTILLEVRGAGGLRLRGSVKNSYTGISWSKTGTAGQWLPSAPPDALSKFLEPVQLWVKHKRLRTTTVFTLLYTLELRGFSQTLQMGEGGDAAVPRSVPLTQEYPVSGFAPAFQGNFAAMERGEAGPEFESFLALPADLPAGISELALDITREHQGTYTKIKALENHLRTNYRYSKNVPALPAGRDFADFFLFEQQAGYCTSFATALAVMARTIGIPTRYVEGFIIPDSADRDGIYRVPGTNAHAWVEAYIPGIGWLPFEATPGFPASDSLPLLDERAPNDTVDYTPGTDANTPPGEAELPPNFFDDLWPGFIEPGSSSIDAGFLFKVFFNLFLIAAMALAIFLLLLISHRWLRIKKYMYDLNQLPPAQRSVAYYNLTLPLLEKIDMGKYPGETPREYSLRIIRNVYSWSLDFKEISEGINLALYSDKHDTHPELAKQTEEFYLYIFNRYLAQVGKLSAFKEIYLQHKYFKHIHFKKDPLQGKNNT
ncbi:MAG: transglutaminase domain-containing protein [Dethiobacter sp.]|jgi:transglutaminase-like putative cysteine protease|nr:transglutaminase domain-containing protein [Dethiobacter sp.]